MYDLWQASRLGRDRVVVKIGDYPTEEAAKRAALRAGVGKYRICNWTGNVRSVRVGAGGQSE